VTEAIAIGADVATIIASLIAIYLFVAKREAISSAFSALINYSFQMTLTELYSKIDKLNELNASEPTEQDKVINILNDVLGQIRGNKRLRAQCQELHTSMTKLAEDRTQLTEPRKRSVVSELRETLKNLDVKNFDERAGG